MPTVDQRVPPLGAYVDADAMTLAVSYPLTQLYLFLDWFKHADRVEIERLTIRRADGVIVNAESAVERESTLWAQGRELNR